MTPARSTRATRDRRDPCLELGAARRDERGILGASLLLAVAVHAVVLLLVVLPDPPPPPAPSVATTPPNLRELMLPPPPIEQPRTVEATPRERRVPLPTRDPDRIEPAREAPTTIELALRAVDLDALVPPPDPLPAPPDPLPVTTIGLVRPELIAETRIDPDYPELGRIGHVSARVVLQAVIGEDGTVREIEIVRCTRPGYGFEAAAAEAVRQWRYRPATFDGLPVAVYLTVEVEFTVR